MPIRELSHGTQVDLVLLVQRLERRPRKDGRDFLKVEFCDRTGTLSSVVWDDVDEIERLLIVGAPFRVGGQFEVHEKFGAQLRLEGFSPAVEGTYDPADLRAGPPVPVPELERRLRELVASVEDPGMAAVLEAVLGENTATWAAYRVAPAAKRVHQAYRHGLLEHCLTVAEAVSGAAAVFPGLDRDLAVTAALIHDIGKLDAYVVGEGDVVELTDAGKLRGEIVIGYERMHGVLNAIPGIDDVRKQAFLHIILAHHGHLEHGSPVTPQTREALLVHMMDNLGGKLGQIDRMEQERPPGAAWSNYERTFGGAVWFPESAEAPEPAEAGAAWLAHPNVAPQQPPHLPSEPVVPAPREAAEPAAAQADEPAADAPMASPPTLHGAPAFTEPEPSASAAPPADPVVPRVAFEDSPAWNPPEPEALTAPPLPSEALTAVPEHDDEPTFPAAEEAEPTEADPAEAAARAKADERAATAAQRAAAFETPGRPTPERSEDDLATSSRDQRRGGPPPPPDAQPLPF